jgi:tetratricopeptide (TPR) repeat protein
MFQKPIEDAIATQLQGREDRAATRRAPTPTPTDSPYSYLTVANAAYDRGAMEEAIRNYEIAAQGLPNDVALYFRLVHLLATNDREQEAIEWGDKAINADPYDPRGWAIKGMALEWAGDVAGALGYIYKALDLDPNSAVALSFLAEAYADLGAFDRATDAAERALALDPTDFNVQRNYGYVMEYLGDYDTAIQAYERALQLAPSQAYIVFRLVGIHYREGDYQAELTLLQDVIDRNPENSTAYALLAEVLLRDMGERAQARDAAERCVSIDATNIKCLRFLGSLQLTDGEYNLCARSFDRAIDAGSTNALDYLYGGTCHIVIDDCSTARDILLTGMGLAKTLETQTDIRDALAQCQTIVTLVPTATPEGYEDATTPTPPAPGS